MKTLRQIKLIGNNEVLCSILPAPQFVKELNADIRLKRFIEEIMNNQRRLKLKTQC